jgi:hypothetical protein
MPRREIRMRWCERLRENDFGNEAKANIFFVPAVHVAGAANRTVAK